MIATRALITFLLIAIAAQLYPYRSIEQRNVVFLADRSASMKGQEEIEHWIAEAWGHKSMNDYGAIVSTGLHAVVDRPLTKDPLASSESYTFRTELNDSFTDLSKGLQLSAAMLREQGGGRIVLLSDGSENAGNATRQARLLQDAGIAIDVVNLASELERDIAIDELIVPASLKQGETFSFELTIQSTFAGEAELRLFEDNKALSTSKVQLEKGENRFSLQSVALESGFHRFRAEIYTDEDGQSANNSAYAFSRVSGPPTVLIVEGISDSSENIESALTASVIAHQTILPEQLSQELAEYAAYDSIILNNVPATRIAAKPMEWLSKAVGDYGVGLMMVGGDESFGLGGYFQTPVERALPVYMDLQGKKQIPSLGLVLVIDRSGSMSDGKLELAKEAAMRTVELLRDVDTVGVVAFDSGPWWVVEPTKLSEREEVINKIKGIQPQGGTEIYSALDAGYQGLLKIDAQRKHMILLTDGQSSTNMSYATITDPMNENRMTISTVAVGEGSDVKLLESLAKATNGRFYFTKDQSTLPAIFSRETVLMSRTYIVDGMITPSIGDAGDWRTLWNDGAPNLNAYIATTPKEMAEVALWSPDGDPLLARWTYGSGRSIAWTSDLTGKWSSDWVKWGTFPKVFAEWVKWTFPQFDSSPYHISTEVDGGNGKLIVESAGDDYASGNGAGVWAGLQNEAGTNTLKRLMPVAPGRYEVQMDAVEPGAYLVQIGSPQDGENAASINGGTTAGYVIPYSSEYQIGDEDGPELLKELAAVTGGRELSTEESAKSYSFDPLKKRMPFDWTQEILVVILLLWLLDIALRRLSLPWQRIMATIVAPIRGLQRGQRNTAESMSESGIALSRLKKRTDARNRFYGDEVPGLKQDRITVVNDKLTKPSNEREKRSTFASNDSHTNQPSYTSNVDITVQSMESSTNDQMSPDSEPRDRTVSRLLAAKNKNKRL